MSKKALDEYDPRLEPQPEVPAGQQRRKKTGRWCKGKVGREHVTEVVVDHRRLREECYRFTYRSRVTGEEHRGFWSCRHIEICVNCGKHTRWSLGADCPDYKENQ